MNLDQEDTTSLHGGTSEFGSEAAGAVSLAESTLTVPDETKNGVSHSSSESGLDVDRLSLGHGSGLSESERVFEPTEMVRVVYKTKNSRRRQIRVVSDKLTIKTAGLNHRSHSASQCTCQRSTDK